MNLERAKELLALRLSPGRPQDESVSGDRLDGVGMIRSEDSPSLREHVTIDRDRVGPPALELQQEPLGVHRLERLRMIVAQRPASELDRTIL